MISAKTFCARLLPTALRTLLLAFAVVAHAGKPAATAAPDRPLFLVVLQPPSPGQARFDVTKHGGTVEFDGGHRLAIRLPEAALEGLLHNPQVRYVQRVVRGDAAASPASAPTTPSTKGLSVTADSATPATVETNGNGSWTSGPYTYDASGNITAVGPGSDLTTDSFQYDAFGRLGAASLYDGSTTRTESYEYDRYGNRTAKTTNGTRVAIATDPATNRLAASTSATYDAVGNVTHHSAIGAIQYDGASMPRQLDNSSPGPTLYIYDANDERVATVHNYSTAMVNWDWTVRDLNGSVIREWESFGPTGSEYMLWTNDYITDAGQLLAANREPAEGGIRHFHVDHLGTPKMITNEAGERISWHVYYPFGIEATSIRQEAAHGYSGEVSRRYTGHERDFNGGTSTENTKYLDYMHARYYNPNWGRFLSVDPAANSANARDPQSWNRYSYVGNHPVLYVDPDGQYRVPGWVSTAGSIATGFLPFAGELQDLGLAVTGYDYVNVDAGKASTGTRVISAAALLLPLVGGKAISEAASFVSRMREGRAFERTVIEALEATKNTRGVTEISSRVTTIPDLLHGGFGVTEIKDVTSLTSSKQLRAQFSAAQSAGTPFNLIVSTNTRTISAAVRDAVRQTGGTILIFNAKTRKFTEAVLDGSKIVN